MSFLEVEGLSKHFGGLVAVDNLDFKMELGETVGLIGPNGSGKTTTLNLLTGFIKPTTGKINLLGEDITDVPRSKINGHGIARTFQLIKPFLEFSALENVMVGRSFGQEPAHNMKAAADESMQYLEVVGLQDMRDVRTKKLTLMQRKRVELARALATKPQLLLLDEHMAGLNHAETEAAMALIQKIKKDCNLTIIVVEHIVKAILGLSDRIIVLNMGAMIAEGEPNKVIHDPEVIDVYLGKPHA